MAELLPCPFCRSKKYNIRSTDEMPGEGPDDGLYFIECGNSACGVFGPVGKSPEMAILVWNRRDSIQLSRGRRKDLM